MIRLSMMLAGLMPMAALAADATVCEQFGGRAASALAPATVLSGNDWAVDDCADVEGHMARFVLQTPEGPLLAPSRDLLRVRIAEMEALQRAREASHLATARDNATDAVVSTAQAVGAVAARPVESVVGVPAGVLRYFRRAIERAGDSGGRAGRRAADWWDDDRPSVAAELRPGEAPPPPQEAEPWWANTGSQLEKLGKRYLGYFRARRAVAERLGVDPYTRNPLLNRHLDALAWSGWAGGRAAGLAMGELGSAATATFSVSRRIRRLVWELSPEQVRNWNRQRMAPLACDAALVVRFLDNGQFSPPLQSAVVDALMALAPQQGCDLLLALAIDARSEQEARYVVDALQLAVAARPRFPVHFEAHGGLLLIRDGEDRRWLPLPVDHLQWTPATRDAFDAPGLLALGDKQVLIGAEASARARAALVLRGWSVVEGAMGPAREMQPESGEPPAP